MSKTEVGPRGGTPAMSPALARCRAEQARAWRNYLDTGERGALLGVSDWMLEEIVIEREDAASKPKERA